MPAQHNQFECREYWNQGLSCWYEGFEDQENIPASLSVCAAILSIRRRVHSSTVFLP